MPHSVSPADHTPRARSASEQRAAELLIAPTALMQLTLDEAGVVVTYMQPMRIAAGTQFMSEGDDSDTGYMLLVLEGEVTVESEPLSVGEAVTLNVLGPGSLIGEIGLVDDEPRSASCTANTEVRCGILSREDLQRLVEHEPAIGAKLVLAVSALLANRVRRIEKKLKVFAQLNTALKQELDANFRAQALAKLPS